MRQTIWVGNGDRERRSRNYANTGFTFGSLLAALVQESELMILLANAENCRSHQTI